MTTKGLQIVLNFEVEPDAIPELLKTISTAAASNMPGVKFISGENLHREDLCIDINDRPIEFLQLSVRALRCLHDTEIKTVGELIRRNPERLLEVRNFSETILNEVRNALSEKGIDFISAKGKPQLRRGMTNRLPLV